MDDAASRKPLPRANRASAPPPRPARGRRRAIAVALGILAGAIFSIPAPADDDPPARRAVHADAGRVSFRFERQASLVRGAPYDEFDTASRERWLLVNARVRAKDDRTIITFSNLVLLRGRTKAREPDEYWLRRDGQGFPSLQPDLPEEITFGWKLRKDERLAAPVELLVRGEQYERRNKTFGWEQWRSTEDPVAQVVLEVVEGKVPRKPADE